jgi:hypothetical protein
MENTNAPSAALGYGLLGLGLGLLIFSAVYLVTVRMRIAERTDAGWAGLFIAIILVPAFLLALVGLSRSRKQGALA